MVIFGWILVTIGALGTTAAVILEIREKHPIYMHLMKITGGILGCGGIILAINSL